MAARRVIPNLDKNTSIENDRVYGWSAHIGQRCGRCGHRLGPFIPVGGDDVDLFGCSACGIGVVCADDSAAAINAAADMFVSMVRIA